MADLARIVWPASNEEPTGIARLGRVVFWGFVVVALFWLTLAGITEGQDPGGAAIFALIAFGTYMLGRGIRYILANE